MTLRHILMATLVGLFVAASDAATPPPLSSPGAGPEPALGPRFYGAVDGSAGVSAAGNAIYTVPIAMPPGTGGMRPELSVRYNSNLRNGQLGLGWFLQGADSRINRCSRTLAQDGYIAPIQYSDTGRYCLDGQRLVAVSGAYGANGTEYRTEVDSVQRIISHGSAGTGPRYFTVETPDGRRRFYGATTDSRIRVSGRSTVRVWALNRAEDTSGNYYRIRYANEDHTPGDGGYAPLEIDYTGNDGQGTPPAVRVQWVYGQRSDQGRAYHSGVEYLQHKQVLEALRFYVDGEFAWQYRLEYQDFGVAHNGQADGKQKRLRAITRCDSLSGGICQQSVSIQWAADVDRSAMTLQPALQVPHSGASPGPASAMPRWHDLNGDGRPDYVHTALNADRRISGRYDILLSNAEGRYDQVSWDTLPAIPPHSRFDSIVWADMDGDGSVDMVTPWPAGEQTEFRIAFATPDGFHVRSWPGYANYSAVNHLSAEHFFFDMNGDKLLDLVVRENDRRTRVQMPDCDQQLQLLRPHDYTIKVALNDGSGFGPLSTWASGVSRNADLGDVDGDGLTDLIEATLQVHKNSGSGFLESTRFTSGAIVPDCTDSGLSNLATFYDVNGDGLIDRLAGAEVELSNGGYFIPAGAVGMFPVADLVGNGRADGYLRAFRNDGWAELDLLLRRDEHGERFEAIGLPFADAGGLVGFLQVVDVDGDGISELVGADHVRCGNQFCENGRLLYWKSDNPAHHLVSSITDGHGLRTEFAYRPLTDVNSYTRHRDSVLPVEDVQDGTQIVTRWSQSNGLGGMTSVEYSYEGLKYDHGGRGLLGFARIVATRSDTGIATTTDYEQGFPYNSQPRRVDVRLAESGQLLNRSKHTYSVAGDAQFGPAFPFLQTRVEEAYSFETPDALLGRTTTTHRVDEFGNITESTVLQVDVATYQSQQTRITTDYRHDKSNWRVQQAERVVTQYWLNGVHDAQLDRRTEYEYGPGGLLHTTRQEPNGPAQLQLTTTLEYDGWGNVITQSLMGPTVPERRTQIQFDSRGQFPETLINPLNHRVRQVFDRKLGVMTRQTDANGQTTSWDYEHFGWRWRERRPDSTVTTRRRYRDEDSGLARSTVYVEILADGVPPVREFLDVLGRTLRTRSRAFDGRPVHVDTHYNAVGLVERTSEPYFAGQSPSWNVQYYDALQRPVWYEPADTSERQIHTYQGRVVTTYRMGGVQHRQLINAMGQVAWSEDAQGTRTEFTYNAAGRRTSVVGSASGDRQSRVEYGYDRLGRQITVHDSNHGRYHYAYDALGQMLTEQSPRMAAALPAQRVEYRYDLLGRPAVRTEPEGETHWVYDNTDHGNLGIGQVHQERQQNFLKTYHYSPFDHGRLTSIDTRIDDITHTHSVSYNAHGKQDIETFPGGYQVKHRYNAIGFLERVQEVNSGKALYQLVSTDAAGKPLQEWLGDDSLATLAYDGASGRLAEQSTVRSGVALQHLSYRYNDLGSLTRRTDHLHNQSESFTYDTIDRLTSAQIDGQDRLRRPAAVRIVQSARLERSR